MGKEVRTTISLPEELLEATDRAIREGKARSRNDFLSIAPRHELAALEQARIDEAFEGMANDPFYREEKPTSSTAHLGRRWKAATTADEADRGVRGRFGPDKGFRAGRVSTGGQRGAINGASNVVIVVPCTTYREGRRIYPSQVLVEAPEGGFDATR